MNENIFDSNLNIDSASIVKGTIKTIEINNEDIPLEQVDVGENKNIFDPSISIDKNTVVEKGVISKLYVNGRNIPLKSEEPPVPDHLILYTWSRSESYNVYTLLENPEGFDGTSYGVMYGTSWIDEDGKLHYPGYRDYEDKYSYAIQTVTSDTISSRNEGSYTSKTYTRLGSVETPFASDATVLYAFDNLNSSDTMYRYADSLDAEYLFDFKDGQTYPKGEWTFVSETVELKNRYIDE